MVQAFIRLIYFKISKSDILDNIPFLSGMQNIKRFPPLCLVTDMTVHVKNEFVDFRLMAAFCE